MYKKIKDSESTHHMKSLIKGVVISSLLITSIVLIGVNSVGAARSKEQSTVKKAAANEIVKISTLINNKKQSYSQPSVVYNGKLLIPVKSIASTSGIAYKYVSKTKQTTLTNGNKKVVLTTGSAVAKVNGNPLKCLIKSLPSKVT